MSEATHEEILRYFEILLDGYEILNPFSSQKLDLVGEVCRFTPGHRLLDLACGKGEMLCRFAAAHGITGVGVDLVPSFLEAARLRAKSLEVEPNVTFVQGEGAAYIHASAETFDAVSCIGATWLGGGFAGTLDLMKRRLAGGSGLLLVGEPYWRKPPPRAALDAIAEGVDEAFTSLPGTLELIEAADLELIEMVLSNEDDWDRYEAPQWTNAQRWLAANPKHPDAPGLRAFNDDNRRNYLEHGRDYLGWGVFVMRSR